MKLEQCGVSSVGLILGCALLVPTVRGSAPSSAPGVAKSQAMTPASGPIGANLNVPGLVDASSIRRRASKTNGAKTLFSWEILKKEEGDEANDKENTSDEPDEIVTDRPDFTEASSNVGRGRIQFEMGYSYSQNRDQGIPHAHSYPEMLVRIGLFADWFELRLGQNVSNSRLLGLNGAPSTSMNGAEDLYLGIGLALTEQQGFLPESRILFQTTVPTGHDSQTAGRVLPGLNYLYGWDVSDFLSIGGSTQGNAAIDADGQSYLLLAQSLTFGYTLTKKLGAYTEVFAFFPNGATAADTSPEYYFDGGFTYKFRPNLQYDIYGGVGLNRHAEDFFVGSGISFRF